MYLVVVVVVVVVVAGGCKGDLSFEFWVFVFIWVLDLLFYCVEILF